MGNTSSIHGCYQNATDRIHCCRTTKPKNCAGKEEIPTGISTIQSSFYIPSTTTTSSQPPKVASSSSMLIANLTSHSSQATTVSNQSSIASTDEENWQVIELPRIYQPLSVPIDKTTSFQRKYSNVRRQRGQIFFMHEQVDDERMEHQVRKEIPGIHDSPLTGGGAGDKRTIWTKAKDRILRGSPRQLDLQAHLAKHKSDEIKDNKIKGEKRKMSEEYEEGVTRLRKGVLESDL